MKKIIIYSFTITTLLFNINCSGGGGGSSSQVATPTTIPSTSQSISNDTNDTEVFSYTTQRSVNVSIDLNIQNNTSQKQILLYETQSTVNTPVGDNVFYENKLVDGVTNTLGYFEVKVTLGNHIDSIWVVIPALAYEEKHYVADNAIQINITRED